MTVDQLLKFYLEHQLSGKASYDVARRIIRQLFDSIRNYTIDELTPRNVLEWHHLTKNTPDHGNRALGILRAAYRWGAPLELTKTDPTRGIKKHPTCSRSRYLTEEELETFMAKIQLAPLQFRTFLLILLHTGCRRSEARLVRWEHIDFGNRLWRKPRVKAGRWHVVPLTEQAIHALKKLPRWNDWIFPGNNNKPWSASAVAKAWVVFRKKAGLEHSNIRMHDLRRTTASHMVINGENISVVQQMLDHSSLQQTAIYARLNVSALARALQANSNRFQKELR